MQFRRLYTVMKLGGLVALSGIAPFSIAFMVSEPQKTVQTLRIEQALHEARQVSNELAEKIRGLLLKEIEKGGFVNAIQVCSEEAQKITHQFVIRKGHFLRRVSLKYRNPKNIPDDDERRRLEEFDRLNREKKLDNEYFEIVEEGPQKYLHCMKPLVTLPLCITCHGPKENIPEEVKAILTEKYPNDQATGFLVGDVRGAISVKILIGSIQIK